MANEAPSILIRSNTEAVPGRGIRRRRDDGAANLTSTEVRREIAMNHHPLAFSLEFPPLRFRRDHRMNLLRHHQSMGGAVLDLVLQPELLHKALLFQVAAG